MTLTSDIMLNHPLWEQADTDLVDTKRIFGRLIDIYIIACAIGIKADKIADDTETPLAQPKQIGRNTYQSAKNEDLRLSLEFMLQNAILNSAHLKLSVDERLQLAFDPEYTVKNFSPANFLTGFANYGIQEIYNVLEGKSPLVAQATLHSYFETLIEPNYEDLLQSFIWEAVQDELQ